MLDIKLNIQILCPLYLNTLRTSDAHMMIKILVNISWGDGLITLTNINLTSRSHGMHLRAFSQKDLWIPITPVKRNLKLHLQNQIQLSQEPRNQWVWYLFWINLIETKNWPLTSPGHKQLRWCGALEQNELIGLWLNIKKNISQEKGSFLGHCYLTCLVLKPEYSGIAGSIPWLPISGFLELPGHQQLIYQYSYGFGEECILESQWRIQISLHIAKGWDCETVGTVKWSRDISMFRRWRPWNSQACEAVLVLMALWWLCGGYVFPVVVKLVILTF